MGGRGARKQKIVWTEPSEEDELARWGWGLTGTMCNQWARTKCFCKLIDFEKKIGDEFLSLHQSYLVLKFGVSDNDVTMVMTMAMMTKTTTKSTTKRSKEEFHCGINLASCTGKESVIVNSENGRMR